MYILGLVVGSTCLNLNQRVLRALHAAGDSSRRAQAQAQASYAAGSPVPLPLPPGPTVRLD